MPTGSDFQMLEYSSDLAQQMNALGLPISFNSTRRVVNGKCKPQRKSKRVSKSYANDILESGNNYQKNYSLSSLKTMQQYAEILDTISTAQSTIDGVLQEDEAITVSSEPCSEDSQTDHLTSGEGEDCLGQFVGKLGSWKVYWDFGYMKVYYFNVDTDESTWYPPPCIKSPVCFEPVNSNLSLLTKNIAAETFDIDLGNLGRILELRGPHDAEKVTLRLSYSCVQGTVGCSFEGVTDAGSLMGGEKKKKPRGRRRRMKTSVENCGIVIEPEELTEKCLLDLTKYWCQRYFLFSRFDEGIKMDEEGWFSVTPEVIAAHHALRCAGGSIVDCFAGVGGNSIQFARRGSHVISIDIDPKKMEYAQHNAAVYGVADHIDFIQGDFFLLAPGLKADKVFLSPPWGGPNYVDVETYDLDMLKPYNGQVLFNRAKEIAPMVVMFLPRTTKVYQLAELAISASPQWFLEVEMNYLNGKLKAITAYFKEGSEMSA